MTIMKKFSSLSSALQRGLKIFFVFCVLITLLDFMINKPSAHWWNFVGFYSLYGFIACVILVLVATAMRRWVMRDEDYYEQDD